MLGTLYLPQIWNTQSNYKISKVAHQDRQSIFTEKFPAPIKLVFVQPFWRVVRHFQITWHIDTFG